MANIVGSSAPLAPASRAAPMRVGHFLKIKGIGAGMSLFNAWGRWRHRLGSGALRIRHLDHITIPCTDLAAAEAFYVGLLGARVLLRVDEAFLVRMGRPAAERTKGIHLSVVFDGGARVDLFGYGSPPPLQAEHPHYAFAVPPGQMLRWKQRLEAAGVRADGPRRLGPPGQASLYFNDPSGNHLELVTEGFVPEIPVGAPDMTGLAYTWQGP